MSRMERRGAGMRFRGSNLFGRFGLGALAIAALLPLAGCGNALVDTLQVSPSAPSLNVGQSVQFTATGTIGHGSGHPSTTQDVTDQATWSSSSPTVATVNSSGEATAMAAGTTTITASMNGYTGVVTATATLTVAGTGSGGGTTGGNGGGSSAMASLAIIPGTQSVAIPGDTTQYIAIGTTGSGATVDMTSQVSWTSSSAQIATIGTSTGVATAVGQGTTTITALYTSNGDTLTATATMTVLAGTVEEYTALTIIPGSQSVSASGQTGQFIALATMGGTNFQEDVTSSKNITWQSSIPTIATISSGGLATGVSAGTTTITAQLTNPDGSLVTATSTVSVTQTAAPEPLLSLTIIPSSISVNNFQLTGQFLAIATYSTPPYVRDVTNSPNTTWISTEPEMFPVDTNSGGTPGASAGIVTAYASGSAVIIAETTSTDGTIQTATATFSCPEVLPPSQSNGLQTQAGGSCYPGEPPAATLLETLTVYNEGLNTTNWEVTAPSATGTPNVLHCGPGWTLNGGTGGSVCTATYPAGSNVVLTAPAGAGAFGGWSYNCTPSDQNGNPLPGPVFWTAAGPNYCVINLSSNNTVGAIFN